MPCTIRGSASRSRRRPPALAHACSHTARFVAFVAGSIAALLLVVTLIDERLLERDLFGRQLVWCARFRGATGLVACAQAPLRLLQSQFP